MAALIRVIPGLDDHDFSYLTDLSKKVGKTIPYGTFFVPSQSITPELRALLKDCSWRSPGGPLQGPSEFTDDIRRALAQLTEMIEQKTIPALWTAPGVEYDNTVVSGDSGDQPLISSLPEPVVFLVQFSQDYLSFFDWQHERTGTGVVELVDEGPAVPGVDPIIDLCLSKIQAAFLNS